MSSSSSSLWSSSSSAVSRPKKLAPSSCWHVQPSWPGGKVWASRHRSECQVQLCWCRVGTGRAERWAGDAPLPPERSTGSALSALVAPGERVQQPRQQPSVPRDTQCAGVRDKRKGGGHARTDARHMVVRRCSGIGAGRACECGPHAGHAPAPRRAGSAEKLRESRVRPTMLNFSPRVVRCNLGNQCLQDSRRIKRRVKRRVTRSMKRCGKEAGGVCLASLVN